MESPSQSPEEILEALKSEILSALKALGEEPESLPPNLISTLIGYQDELRSLHENTPWKISLELARLFFEAGFRGRSLEHFRNAAEPLHHTHEDVERDAVYAEIEEKLGGQACEKAKKYDPFAD